MMIISMINLRVLDAQDFKRQPTDAVFLTPEERKIVLTKLQEKKREVVVHPFLKQKMPYGLLPFVQSNLLATFVRGEIAEYPPYIMR